MPPHLQQPPQMPMQHRPPSKARGLLVLGGIAVAVLLIGGLIVKGISGASAKKRGDFEGDWGTYLELYDSKHAPKSGEDVSPKSKVMVIDMTKGADKSRLDKDVHYDLAESLRATNPDEVGTVCFIKWDKFEIGTYSDGTSGYAATCELELVNPENGAIIAQQRFLGGDPPEMKNSSGSKTGPKPTDQVIDFLEDFEWKS